MYLHYNILVYARCAVFLHTISLTTQLIRENKTAQLCELGVCVCYFSFLLRSVLRFSSFFFWCNRGLQGAYILDNG